MSPRPIRRHYLLWCLTQPGAIAMQLGDNPSKEDVKTFTEKTLSSGKVLLPKLTKGRGNKPIGPNICSICGGALELMCCGSSSCCAGAYLSSKSAATLNELSFTKDITTRTQPGCMTCSPVSTFAGGAWLWSRSAAQYGPTIHCAARVREEAPARLPALQAGQPLLRGRSPRAPGRRQGMLELALGIYDSASLVVVCTSSWCCITIL